MYQRHSYSLQKTADIRLDRKAHFPYLYIPHSFYTYILFVAFSIIITNTHIVATFLIHRLKNPFCTIYFGISHIRTELFLSKTKKKNKRNTHFHSHSHKYTENIAKTSLCKWVIIVGRKHHTQMIEKIWQQNSFPCHFLSFLYSIYSYSGFTFTPFVTAPKSSTCEHNVPKEGNVVVLLLFQFIYDSLKTVFYTLRHMIAIPTKAIKETIYDFLFWFKCFWMKFFLKIKNNNNNNEKWWFKWSSKIYFVIYIWKRFVFVSGRKIFSGLPVTWMSLQCIQIYYFFPFQVHQKLPFFYCVEQYFN